MTAPGRIVAGRRAVVEAVRARRAREVMVVGSARRTPGLRDALRAAEGAGVRVRAVPREVLDRMAPRHQGIAARVDHPGQPSERELALWPFGADDVVVVLDGIEDPQNLGAAARAAEAAGAAMLVMRRRRAAGVTPAAVRASAGALLHLPHARVGSIARAIGRLRQSGFSVIGLDAEAEATVYDGPCPSGRVVLVVGSEERGLSRLVRESCDALISLPMRGRVSSLNAAASLAAVLYAWVVPSRKPGG